VSRDLRLLGLAQKKIAPKKRSDFFAFGLRALSTQTSVAHAKIKIQAYKPNSVPGKPGLCHLSTL
jgi:hypothetical protein